MKMFSNDTNDKEAKKDDEACPQDAAESQNAGECGGETERVRLKSLFGLHPFISFAIKVLLVFLAICIIPSFFTSSRRLFVSSDVYPLRVEVDGQPVGITPCNLRIKPGRHEIDFFYADEKVHHISMRVRPALFLSYLFEYSQKANVSVRLGESAKQAAYRNFLQDCLDYELLFKTDATRIQKPYFSYYKTLLGNEAKAEAVSAARYFIANRDAVEDFKDSFGGLVGTLDFSCLKDGDDDFNLEIDDTVPFDQNGGELKLIDERNVGGRDFVEFDSVMVAKDLVDTNIFRAFLQERPEFSVERKSELIQNGLADDDYLSAFAEGGSARSVSYRIASEFAKWFGSKYSCKARLLTKPEYVRLYGYKSLFRNYVSGLFEMTSTSFITYEALSGRRLNDDDRNAVCSVFDKAGVNMSKELFCLGAYNRTIDDESRLRLVGVISPDSCYETVGFRLAIDK